MELHGAECTKWLLCSTMMLQFGYSADCACIIHLSCNEHTIWISIPIIWERTKFICNVHNTCSLFTKLLTPGLTCELCNPFDDWLESISPTNHAADYLIRELIQELKIWRISPYALLEIKSNVTRSTIYEHFIIKTF